MYLRFYDGEDSKILAQQFAEKVMAFNKNVSPAQIQGFFMFHKHSDQKEVIEKYKMIWEL